MESIYLYHGDADVNVTMDPLRLASQIVSGIGFLGAGVILIILAVEMLPVLRFAGPSRLQKKTCTLN
ncbi:hypothetical protein M3221_01285 [Domibacillus indicus]|uniref:hypothetical protein n=1 Tax=Domibacillus indicus TaxID=1437523 RepID=UPI002040295F|nr:hypothetical protein [Domibacillus indicus]MCM3787045.1 hypothetical protein [Domibacillus indicus]